MAKTKTKSRRRLALSNEPDAVYLLKLVLYLIVGAQWLWLSKVNGATSIPLPVGFVVGLIVASHEHFQIDRKIEYAVLLVALFVGFWAHVGVFASF